MKAMEISRTGLDVEWRRLEVIAENLANAGTARTADGTAFQPRELISGPKGEFASYLEGHPNPDRLAGVEVYGIEPTNDAPRVVHEPGNPQADAQGMVTYPGVDQAAQMTLLVKTARAYQSNIVAMTAARDMYSKAIDLGGRS
ncbi:MAG TPA: flagellar basal body rod protein FlgC [Acetobacteraceae bacterium]|nr:flagellar basal body rod protein FlgC [Acetobacteraceae bacterium]